MSDIEQSLKEILGERGFSNAPEELWFYSRDPGVLEPHKPDYVALPKTAEQVQKVVQLANREKIPIVPMGNGMSLTGLVIPLKGGIVMDMKRMNKILEVTENVVLIDHHASTPGKMEQYVGKYTAVVNCDGPESGCSLTWKHFFPEEEMPEALQLIRDYDTWTHAIFPVSTYFTTGLELFDTNPESYVWDDLLGFCADYDYVAEDIVQIGRNCVEFRDNLAKTACDEFGFETVWEDCKCFVLYCSTMRSSLCFKERIDQYDMCIMVVPHGNGVTIRLYSNEVVDVSEVAKKFDGGGHKGAGGFVCDEIPEEFLPGGKKNG